MSAESRAVVWTNFEEALGDDPLGLPSGLAVQSARVVCLCCRDDHNLRRLAAEAVIFGLQRRGATFSSWTYQNRG